MQTSIKFQKSWLGLIPFLIIVVGAGSIIGIGTAPGDWFAALEKPGFNPPSWVFAPVWFTLYVMIAVAGWRTFVRDRKGTAMLFWVGQMLLNWSWSVTFFSLQLIWGAFAVIIGVWLCIIGFMVSTWRDDRESALLFVPYFAWVSFASILNLAIGVLN